MPLARLPLARFLQLAAAAVLLCAAAAHADDYSEITTLLKDGKSSQALVQVEQRLASHPKDPQLRFLRGVAQSEGKQTKAAIETFTALTRDYPELPEPYNNLAVLYAQENQLDKARTALEMAIRTNPSYATAHENLGDIYAKLAGQAYNKALQLDAGHAEAIKPKLALIRELFSAPAGATRQTTTTTPPEKISTVAATPATAVSGTNAQGAATTVPAAPAAPTPESKPTSVSAPGETAKEQAAAAVQAWAKAWTAQNMDAYFAAYTNDFVPSRQQSRAEWEKDRRARITDKTHISVTLSGLHVKVEGDKAVVSFRQDYRGDALHVNSPKTLTLVQQAGSWKIARESVSK